MNELDYLNQMVLEITGTLHDAEEWWNTPNTELFDKTPKDLWLENPEALSTYLQQKVFGF